MTSPIKVALSEARETLARLEQAYAPLTTAEVLSAAPDSPLLEDIDPVHMIEWVFRAEQIDSLVSRDAPDALGFAYAKHRSAQPLETASEPDFALAA